MKLKLKTLLAGAAFLYATAASAVVLTDGGQYYLMHSGGAHVGANKDRYAVLESAEASAPTILTLSAVDDTYYNISLPDNGGYMSRSGKWNTVFADDAAVDDAQFAVEPAGNFFVRIRCKANNLYLGTDDMAPGSAIYCDKKGDDARYLWYFSTDPTEKPLGETVVYPIDPLAVRQGFDGWGVSLCWWANMCGKWSDEKIDELVDWLVSPDGLNFRIFRYNIGGGDDPENRNCTAHHMGSGKGLRAEMEGFKDSSDGSYIWERDAAQRKIMLKIRERRPDAIFEAFSNSCPWYMTYSGCVAGNKNAGSDNLKPEYYEEFAHYLVDVCKHYKDEYGLEFLTLDPFNEPETSYWGANGGQEGCHFDTQSQIEFLKVLAPVLKASGLRTKISASDETSVAQSVTDFIAYRNAGILDLVGQWNTHTYTADDISRAKISALCLEENMPLWMSEVGVGGSGISGNLSLAQKLITDMRIIAPSAWIDWQYVEDYNDQWCLVQCPDFDENKVKKIKNYYIRSHFSRFIEPGSRILATVNGQTLAALSPDRKSLILVAINNTAAPMHHSADLSAFRSAAAPAVALFTDRDNDMVEYDDFELNDRILEFSLPMQSIVTFVIPVESVEADNFFRDGAEYLIYPRAGLGLTVAADESGVQLRNLDCGSAQRFTLTKGDNDTWKFTNAAGRIITATAGYALKAADNNEDGQNFNIIKADNYFYRISNPSDNKSFDIENVRIADGSKIGLWNYDDVAPVHRQWGFISLTALSEAGVKFSPDNFAEAPALMSISASGIGSAEITNLSGADATLRLYSAGGNLINSYVLRDNISIAPGAGLYILHLTVSDGRTATQVLLL